MSRELHNSVERDRYLRMLFQQIPGAIWTTDGDLRLTTVSGHLANSVIPRGKPGMSVYDVLGSRDPANRMIASHRAALLGEPQSFEYQMRDRWYHVLIEQLKGNNGDVAGCIAVGFDITEQRTTLQALARKEALLAQAQRLAHVGSFEWDIPTRAITWSDELQRIYGIEPGDFRGTFEDFLERVHPDDLERTKSVVFDALRKAAPFMYENRVVRADGSVRVLRTRGDIIADRYGQPVRVAGCCWDVTELSETMDSLEKARSLLEAAIEASADGLFVVDVKGHVSVYNHRFLSLWRIPQDLAHRRNGNELLAYISNQLEDPQQFLSTTRDLYLHPDRESFDVEYFKDGRVFERYSGPQRIGENIVGRVWSFRDVTERETLLRRAVFLADATRLLSSLDIEPALDSVARLSVPFLGEGCAIDLLQHGLPRRLLFVSRGAESFSPELHRSIMEGHSIIYSAGTRSCMSVPLVVKGTVEGAITFLSAPMHKYRKADLEFAETLARRAALAVENADLYRKAQEALEARDEFLTIAAHEIRGPITSMHMAVQGLQNSAVSSAEKPKLLEIVGREDRRLAQFVDELLDLGNIRHGPLFFTFEEVNLADVVREAANDLAADLTRSRSALSIVNDGQPVGQWDKHRIYQVASNLLSNAIKFGEGKPIAVTVHEHQGLTTLTVRDEGIGIPPEMLERLFHPFERAVSVRNYGGLGLGLFITRTIVEGLGGTVRVESTPRKGSTFTVELRNARTL
jgi:PAS domain S-box-containing protein